VIGFPEHRPSSVTTALLRANVRFWPTILPSVASQLRAWERHAHAIPDAQLRALALSKLANERFNAEVAATLATTAPLRLRPRAVEAIVAYEVLYDYLDGLTEQPLRHPLADGRRLYTPFEQATVVVAVEPRRAAQQPPSGDRYVECLSHAMRCAFASLPSASAVSPVAQRAASRCAEAQTRTHAAEQLGDGQLREWAEREAAGAGLSWRVFLAGSMASVLCVHALVAASTKPEATEGEALRLDRAYLSICALTTLLDSLVDSEADRATGQANFLRHYATAEELGADLADTARLALEQIRGMPSASHHTMMLTGVLAYYLSAPTASSPVCSSASAPVRRQLEPLLAPSLAVMRTWRTLKRIKRVYRPRTSSSRDHTGPQREDAG